jgi:SET domain-containing protein
MMANRTIEQDVDGQNMGNKMRFINHSSTAANCVPRMILCNSVVRIAIEALRDIKKGTELVFDYGDE